MRATTCRRRLARRSSKGRDGCSPPSARLASAPRVRLDRRLRSVPTRYFNVKVEQERTVEEGGVPWTIVRATQFHELVIGMFTALGSWRVLPLPRAPHSADRRGRRRARNRDVRRRAAASEPRQRRRSTNRRRPHAGADVALARGPRLLVPIPLPGALGRALRAGGLTCDRPDVRGTIPFEAALRPQAEQLRGARPIASDAVPGPVCEQPHSVLGTKAQSRERPPRRAGRPARSHPLIASLAMFVSTIRGTFGAPFVPYTADRRARSLRRPVVRP